MQGLGGSIIKTPQGNPLFSLGSTAVNRPSCSLHFWVKELLSLVECLPGTQPPLGRPWAPVRRSRPVSTWPAPVWGLTSPTSQPVGVRGPVGTLGPHTE